ncbi:MAG: methionyl-tRNA formyltransferase [Bacteroidales bacterium]
MNPRIVFMGTPTFAVESLKALVEGGYNVVGVITMPDKPAGRGHKIQYSPVKEYALIQDLPLLQPERLKDEIFIEQLRTLKADLQIVVAFRMLPEVVWNMPPLGTFNLHGSLLPQYRGAAPINWAIINGEKETGITTFFLTHEIDTGEVIDKVSIPILPSDNAGTIHDKLMTLGAQLVVKTVDAIRNNTLTSIPQSELIQDVQTLRPAPKLTKENCTIDWNKSSIDIHNFVRGLSPYPAALTTLHTNGQPPQQVKIFETEIIEDANTHSCGSLSITSDGYLKAATATGALKVISLQLPGKKRVHSNEWLRGFRYLNDSEFK